MKNKILKSSVFIALLMSFSFVSNAQETKTDSTTQEIETDSIQKDQKDWKIAIGKTRIIIQKDGESDTLNLSDEERDKKDNKKKKKNQRTNHFAGLDLGINGLLSPNQSVDLQEEAQFLELNYRKSIEFSINFWEKYLPIAKEKFGVTTGMGIKYNSYDLVQDVIIVNQNNVTIPTVDSARSISKNRFKTTSVHMPLMLETNIGKDVDHSFHLAAGGIVSYVLNARTKQKYKQEGETHKSKDRSEFNVNSFQFAAIARVGYGDFTLYASYNLTSLFEEDKGPDVTPFTVGISLISF